MEERIVEFIAGLRAAGVRISVAESADSFRAITEVGVIDRDIFRSALRTTLIKDPADVEAFDRLFPLYFGREAPPMLPATEGMDADQQQELRDALDSLPQELADLLRKLLDGQLSEQEMAQMRQQLQQAQNGQGSDRELQELMQQLAQAMRNRLAQLLNWLLSGQGPSKEQLQQIGQEVGLQRATHPYQQSSLTERMLRAMGMEQLAELLREMLEQLAEAGMSHEALKQLAETMQANADALGEQVNQFVGASIARQVTNQQPPPARMSDLMQRPFQSLSQQERSEERSCRERV